jgi:RND family efflux transporter MFP subunit
MKMKKQKIMKKIVILLSAVAVMAGCGAKKTAVEDAAAQAKAPVKVAVAQLEQIEQSAVFTSNIEAFQQNNIAPSMPMRINRIMVDVGAKVARGQLLVTMDPTQYNQVEVQLNNAQADYDRMKKVYDAGGISRQQMDQVEAGLAVQKTQAANLLENTQLRSPIGGVVTARNFDAGDMWNGAMPILTVMQIDRLKVSFSVSEQYFPQVKTGMAAQIKADMYPDRVFDGRVTLVAPAIDPATRTFMIEVTLPNAGGELRPGMFARTKLTFGTAEGIMVDDIAIQRQLGTNDKYVYVDVDGRAERRMVTTGMQAGTRVEILGGVNVGDRVITAGIAQLMQGTEIEITE